MVFHHALKQRQPRAHKAVFYAESNLFIQPYTQQTVAAAHRGRPAHRAGQRTGPVSVVCAALA